VAGFKTHIATSTIVGLGYGGAAYVAFDVPLESCLLSAGLCSVAGILPDIDSESGQTLREITGFIATVVLLLSLDHLRALEVKYESINHESIVLAGGCVYIIMRFGLSGLLNRYTVHRGMWHSIPAALVAGLATSFLCDCPEPFLRLMKVIAVLLGYLTHLVLDEIYSFDTSRGRVRIKKSFGTALKLWNPKSLWSNAQVYGILIVLSVFLVNDPMLRGGPDSPIHTFARDAVDEVIGGDGHPRHEAIGPETLPASKPIPEGDHRRRLRRDPSW